MKIRFRTESGSLYMLDKDRMTWERTNAVPGRSGAIRHESGELMHWPDIIYGEPAILSDTNFQAGCNRHYVLTTPVVEISEEQS